MEPVLVSVPKSHYRDDEIFPLPDIYPARLQVLQQTWRRLPPGVACPKCKRRGRKEAYRITTEKWGIFRYDIIRAQQILQDGRLPMYIWPGVLLSFVGATTIIADHLDHLPNPTTPGIFIYITAPDGSTQRQLIDGNHRAARALCERRFFQAYVLSSEESARCQIV